MGAVEDATDSTLTGSGRANRPARRHCFRANEGHIAGPRRLENSTLGSASSRHVHPAPDLEPGRPALSCPSSFLGSSTRPAWQTRSPKRGPIVACVCDHTVRDSRREGEERRTSWPLIDTARPAPAPPMACRSLAPRCGRAHPSKRAMEQTRRGWSWGATWKPARARVGCYQGPG
jgi:hypothetical protein